MQDDRVDAGLNATLDRTLLKDEASPLLYIAEHATVLELLVPFDELEVKYWRTFAPAEDASCWFV